MDLVALRYFQAVAHREHMGRAAQDLHVAQPSLSRAIGRLEAELGAPLFHRTGRRVRLNRHGAVFLARVDRALGELDDARRELEDATGLESGSVAIASETLLDVAALVRRFRGRYPDVDLRLHQASPARMVERLGDGSVDLCLASRPVVGPGLESVDVLEEEVLLAMPRDHRLAGRGSVDVASLAGEPFVAGYPGRWERVVVDEMFAAAGIEPVLVCESDEAGASLELIATGLGIGLIPAMGAAAWPDARLVYATLDHPAACRTLRLVRRRDGYLPAAARRLHDLAVEHFGNPGTPGDGGSLRARRASGVGPSRG